MKKAPSSMGRSLSSRYHPSSVKRQHSTEQMLLTLTRLTPFPNSCYWPSETGLEGELHVVVLACDFQPMIAFLFPQPLLATLPVNAFCILELFYTIVQKFASEKIQQID